MRTITVLAVVAFVSSCSGGGRERPDPISSTPPTAAFRLASGDFQSAEPGAILQTPVVVQVTDVIGHPLINFSVTFAVQSGGGLVAPVAQPPFVPTTTIATDVNGMARILWQLGPDTLDAQIVRISAPTAESSIDVRAHAVNSYFVSVVSGDHQQSKAGDSLGEPLVVRTLNAQNTPASRVRVQWSVSPSLATFISADTMSDENGLARARLNPGSLPGEVVTTAVVRSGSVILYSSVVPGNPAALEILPRSFSLPMEGMIAAVQSKVRDRFGNEVQDVGVSMTVSDTTIAVDWGEGLNWGERIIRAKEAGSTSIVFRTGSVVDSIPVRVPSFNTLSVGNEFDCGITKLSEGLCWSRLSAWDHGASQGSGNIIAAAFSTATCIATQLGVTTCWGYNVTGNLGGGSSVRDLSRPQSNPVTVVGGHRFVQLTAGMSHVCGLEQGGTVYCWGATWQIGSDSTTQACGPDSCTSEPAPVRGGLRFVEISALAFHTCGVTITGDGYCWGLGDVGQLGSKPLDDCANAVPQCAGGPQLVSGGHKWTSIASGRYHSCGLATDGETYCWGANGTGTLGVGSATPDSSTIPLRVVGNEHFSSIASGMEQSCGLTADGRAFCWGARLTFVPVARRPDLSFTVVATSFSGGDGFCGISVAGGIHCQFFPEFLTMPQSVAPRSPLPVPLRDTAHF